MLKADATRARRLVPRRLRPTTPRAASAFNNLWSGTVGRCRLQNSSGRGTVGRCRRLQNSSGRGAVYLLISDLARRLSVVAWLYSGGEFGDAFGWDEAGTDGAAGKGPGQYVFRKWRVRGHEHDIAVPTST